MDSSPLFCTHCGAANLAQAAFCYACGQAIQAPGNTFATPGSGPLQVGALLKGRYQIVQQIGTGGFGAVYEAEDVDLGKRLVAVKEMSQHNLSPQEINEAAQAFKQEALLLADLMHEHLPRIYEHFSEGGRWYLVMDCIRGETLEERLQRVPGAHLSLDEALEIALQLCSVLNYLHTRQPPIIFRDLKPSNVILTSTGNLFLIDFGIARHFKPGQVRDTIAFGSPGYAPPEQYGKAQTTPRADIYALGAILHQLVSGEDPSLSPFRFVPLAIDAPALQDLLTRMLDLDESKRPASMAEVRQALQRVKEQPQALADLATQPIFVLPPLSPAAQPGLGLPPLLQPSQLASRFPPLRQPRVTHQINGPNPLIYEGHSNPVHSVAWSPNSASIASASAEIVRVWDIKTGSEICAYEEHLTKIVVMAWAPHTMHIASLSQDNNLRIWNANNGKTVYSDPGGTLRQAGMLSLLAWSPNERCLALAGDGRSIQIIDMLAHKLVESFPVQPFQEYSALSWSPDGGFLAAASGKTVYIWNAYTKALLLIYEQLEQVSAVAWSPNSSYIALCGYSKLIQIWQARTKELRGVCRDTSLEHIHALSWSPNGRMLASGDLAGTVQVWDSRTGNKLGVYNGHKDGILSVAWSPDGRYLASGSSDGMVRIWRDPALFL